MMNVLTSFVWGRTPFPRPPAYVRSASHMQAVEIEQIRRPDWRGRNRPDLRTWRTGR